MISKITNMDSNLRETNWIYDLNSLILKNYKNCIIWVIIFFKPRRHFKVWVTS